MIDDLLRTADALARLESRRPRQTSLRRAVSSAYYAVFHALARSCADELIGVTRANSVPWTRTYRALQHGEAKNAFKDRAVLELEPGIAIFASAFITLQEQRHIADYDPRPFPHGRKATLDYIEEARRAVEALRQADSENKRALASYGLLRSR
jgi:hypothetical protein